MSIELITLESTPPAIYTPAGRGFEEETPKEDLIMPRAKLLQGISPEVMDPASSFKAGMIINSLTKEVLPLEFVPIFKFTNWIRFNPRNSEDPNYDLAYGPGELIWQSNDPSDPRVLEEAVFGPNGEKPKAIKFMNFLCLFPGQPGPVVLPFSVTSFKAGKKLISLAMRFGGDMFGRRYKLSVKQVTNDKGTYFVLDVDPAGILSPEWVKIAESWYETFAAKAKEIKVDHEEVPSAE